MFNNYLIAAIRNMKKRMTTTLIQSLGLALGLTVFIMAGIIADYEENFDTFFEKVDRIYTISVDIKPEAGMGLNNLDATFSGMQPVLAIDVPEIEKSSRVLQSQQLVQAGDAKFYEAMRFVDPDFLDILELDFIHGSAETALDNPNSVILSESIVNKYFDMPNPIGQTFLVDTRHQMQVTGVFADLPQNSHLVTNLIVQGGFQMVSTTAMLATISSFEVVGDWENLAGGNNTYILLPEGTDPADIEKQLEPIFDRYLNAELKELIAGFKLRPLQNMNLYVWETSGIPAMAALRLLGLLILIIAGLNYTTLSAAQGLGRMHEVGIRKTIGASRGQLLIQFLVESVAISGIAMVLAVVAVKYSSPILGQAMKRPITLDLLSDPSTIIGLILIVILTGILAGLYPAHAISRVEVNDALKEDRMGKGKSSRARNILLTVQFTGSIVMTIMVVATYMQNQKLQEGPFSTLREQVVNVGRMEQQDAAPLFEALRTGWLEIPAVEAVTISSQVPFNQSTSLMRATPVPGDESRKIDMQQISIGEDFTQLYDVELLAGRALSRDYAEDTYRLDDDGEYDQPVVNLLINALAVTALGYETPLDAIDKIFYEVGENASDTQFRIVGVTEDVNYLGFFTKLRPFALKMPADRPNIASIRISTDDIPAALAAIDAVWNRLLPQYPIERLFLDEGFENIFVIFQGVNIALLVFSILGVSLATVGLFGMTILLANRRTKEISIRKVLGASVSSLVQLLTWQISKPVLVAVVIASPIAYFASGLYLDFFPDHIELSLVFFALVGFSVVLFAWLIVGLQAFRVSTANPVDSLRYE